MSDKTVDNLGAMAVDLVWKNKRITALEAEVARLEAMVERALDWMTYTGDERDRARHRTYLEGK